MKTIRLLAAKFDARIARRDALREAMVKRVARVMSP
jgi:hypothetical protein